MSEFKSKTQLKIISNNYDIDLYFVVQGILSQCTLYEKLNVDLRHCYKLMNFREIDQFFIHNLTKHIYKEMTRMLPIGSIVYLKEGRQKIMILNCAPVIEEFNQPVLYDYSGCRYPAGLNPNEIFYFNQENIDTVIFEGYSDDEQERFEFLFQEWYEKEGKNIKKGEVGKM